MSAFGYFPTYSLGNVYAGCLYKALRNDVADLDVNLGSGKLEPAVSWLQQRLQKHGGRFPAAELISSACGQEVSVDPLLDYLNEKFLDLYGLAAT